MGKKKFNYTVIYANTKTKTYSENDEIVNKDKIIFFIDTLDNKYKKGIVGILPHSIRKNKIESRPISQKISKEIRKRSCVSCGSTSDIFCDHKNDLYNEKRVLNIKTQNINDFQPLCNHCNLLKRQVQKIETKYNKIYSAKNIDKYKMFPFEFPWEKKKYDKKDITCKKDTYWYDPIEFNDKINKYYLLYFLLREFKKKYTKLHYI